MQVCLRAAAGLPEHLHLARAHLRPTTLAPCFAEGHTPLTVEDVRDPRNLAALLPTVGDFWGDYFFVPGSRPAVGLHIQTFDITSIFYFLYNFGVLRQDRCGAGFAPWGVSRMLYNPRTGWLVLLFIPRAPPAGSSPAGLRSAYLTWPLFNLLDGPCRSEYKLEVVTQLDTSRARTTYSVRLTTWAAAVLELWRRNVQQTPKSHNVDTSFTQQ